MFKNQVIIITGAGRGIGAATARLFASYGATVVVNDLDGEACTAIHSELLHAGTATLAVPGDVTDPAFPEHLVAAAYDTFGHVNVLVNNAGFTWDGMLHKMGDLQWSRMLDIHVTAPFRIIRVLALYWREAAKQEIAGSGEARQRRCIVNVSSTSGLHGNAGQVNYATAKMGVIGLTKTVAREWGRYGIRCNAVAFGFIDTRLTRPKEEGYRMQVAGQEVALGIPGDLRQAAFATVPLGRPGTPEEAAGGIVLLASPLANYVTGHTLEVTGGMGI